MSKELAEMQMTKFQVAGRDAGIDFNGPVGNIVAWSLQKISAATKIQAAVRGFLSRREAAATKVQAAVRGFLARRKYAKIRNAALKIRNAAKRYLLRKSIKKVNQMTRLEMVTALSGFIRDINVTGPDGNIVAGVLVDGLLGNIVAGVLVGQKISAAIKIQALFRGYATKRVVEAMRPNLQAARLSVSQAFTESGVAAHTRRTAAETMRRCAVTCARSQLRFGLISVCLPALKEKNYWYPYTEEELTWHDTEP
jgi:hypothetical protein